MSKSSHHDGGNVKGGGRKTPDVSHVSNPDVDHEISDVRVGPIAKFVVGLFIFGVIVCILMLLLFNLFERRRQGEPDPPPLARTGDERFPPEPRLQAAPGFGVEVKPGQRVDLQLKEPQAEMKVVNQIWEKQLTTYGWVDQGAGTVRIPIEEAKKLMVRKQEEKAKTAPAVRSPEQPPPGGEQRGNRGEEMPASSSSGQMLEKRNQ
jgi:hypothetical protein